ncbi:MAG: hypothetical protein GY810_32580 [Aureispira sp.]|nr:hypothetical protein [Aureispira sp.]
MQKSTTLQIALISGSVLLLVIMYAFGRTVPLEKKGEEEATEQQMTEEVLLSEARNSLDSAKIAWLSELDKQKSQATTLEEEGQVLKLISKTWNEWGNFAAGAVYAAEVAKLLPSAESWSITGTTYGIAFQRNEDVVLKKFVARKAIHAFEQAASMEPDTLQHHINEALMHVELSSIDATVGPMIGIQKLLSLDKKFPDNITISMVLGRLSLMRSGDVKKAIKRFEKVITIADAQQNREDLLEAHFLLVECYKQLNNSEKVLYHYNQCIVLTESDKPMQDDLINAKNEFEQKNN